MNVELQKIGRTKKGLYIEEEHSCPDFDTFRASFPDGY